MEKSLKKLFFLITTLLFLFPSLFFSLDVYISNTKDFTCANTCDGTKAKPYKNLINGISKTFLKKFSDQTITFHLTKTYSIITE